MRASAYVGRVGGLAVALGIGVAVTVSGAAPAWAAPSDSASTGEDAATSAASIGGQTSRSAGRGRSGGPAASDSISGTTTSRSEASRTKNQPRAATVSAPASESSTATKVSAPAPAAARHDSTADAFNLPAASTAIQATSGPEAVVAQSLAASAGIAPVAAAVTPAAPAMTVAAPADGVDSAPNPFAGHSSPLNPAQSAVSWVVLAAARRERGSARAAHRMPATVVSTSDLADTESVSEAVELAGTRARPAAALPNLTGSAQSLSPLAAVTAADPISAFFGQIQAFVTQIVQAITQAITSIINIFVPAPAPVNKAPVAVAPTVGIPDGVTGVVTGQVNATDPDGDPLTYDAPATTSKGSVVIDSSTGVFTYTPTVAARDNAAQAGAPATDKADAFTVTVTDSRGGTASILVGVAISPTPNHPPVPGTTTIGTPDATTGVINGSVTATDPDGNPLTYTATTQPGKGSVTVDAGTGAFTYTPTPNARDAAADPNATGYQQTDSFTVTVTDGYGASTDTLVTVPVSPKAITVTAAFPYNFTTSVAEGNSGTTVKPVVLNLSAPSTETVTVNYEVRANFGSATAGQDYVAELGSVVFAPGQTEATIQAKIIGDTVYEGGQETFYIYLTSATGAKIVRDGADGFRNSWVAIKIDDDDPAPAAAILAGLAQAASPAATTAPVSAAATNKSPVITESVLGTPNATTGAATGTVVASDPNGDKLTYKATT